MYGHKHQREEKERSNHNDCHKRGFFYTNHAYVKGIHEAQNANFDSIRDENKVKLSFVAHEKKQQLTLVVSGRGRWYMREFE